MNTEDAEIKLLKLTRQIPMRTQMRKPKHALGEHRKNQESNPRLFGCDALVLTTEPS